MDYEQKYNEALKSMRDLYNKMKYLSNPTALAITVNLENTFPELKESEDERIRKEIISYIKSSAALTNKDWIAYLEKQGEHTRFRESIQVGDKVTRNEAGDLVNLSQLERVAKPSKKKTPQSESEEDEKIRKDIIRYIKKTSPAMGENIENMVAWLEKQGEQKLTRPVWKYKKDHTPLLRDSFILNKYGCVAKSPSGALVSDVWVLDFDELAKLPKEDFERENEQKIIDKVEPKFRVGDWAVHDMSDGRKVIRQIINMTNKSYVLDGEGFNTFYFNDLENDYHLWTIQDAKDGDVLLFEGYYNSIVLFQGIGINGKGRINYHCKCDLGDYSFGIQGDVACLGTIEKDAEHYHPATKEQRDILFKKMKEAGYEWDAEKKELKKIENKHAWSKEDEEMLKEILDEIYPYGECSDYPSPEEQGYYYTRNRMVDWLKSLKTRFQPQPKQEWSEKDEMFMDELESYIKYDENLSCVQKNWRIDRLKSLEPNHWKPSEKQMDDLKDTISFLTSNSILGRGMESLYNDLKKL